MASGMTEHSRGVKGQVKWQKESVSAISTIVHSHPEELGIHFYQTADDYERHH